MKLQAVPQNNILCVLRDRCVRPLPESYVSFSFFIPRVLETCTGNSPRPRATVGFPTIVRRLPFPRPNLSNLPIKTHNSASFSLSFTVYFPTHKKCVDRAGWLPTNVTVKAISWKFSGDAQAVGNGVIEESSSLCRAGVRSRRALAAPKSDTRNRHGESLASSPTLPWLQRRWDRSRKKPPVYTSPTLFLKFPNKTYYLHCFPPPFTRLLPYTQKMCGSHGRDGALGKWRCHRRQRRVQRRNRWSAG